MEKTSARHSPLPPTRRCLGSGCLLAALLLTPIWAAPEYSTPYYFTTLAGVASVGSADGPARDARFASPAGIASDAQGNLYVTDGGNRTVRKISAAGTVTTLAGTAGRPAWNPLDGPMPSLDGTGPDAQFISLEGLAVDAAGNVYVADEHTIRKITPAGVVSTFAGLAGGDNWGTADGPGSAARFSGPHGLTVDGAGNVYVADDWNNTIRKITPTGVVSTFAGQAAGYPPADGSTGSTDGTTSSARFNFPQGVAADSAGNIYVADTHNNTIRKITATGVVTTLAGSAGTRGSADGTGSDARFDGPYGLAVDRAGNVYVADNWNRLIRKITPAGVVTTLAGLAGSYGDADGPGSEARFGNPVSVAVDGTGNVFVVDVWANTIRKITPTGVVSTMAGVSLFQSSGSSDGPAGAARFSGPHGLAVDGAGNVYVADTLNSTVRKITPSGSVTTLAGAPGSSGSADGPGSAARLYFPKGVAADATGNTYIADTFNQTIRKVTPAGVVLTLAGSAGVTGAADGAGPTARFAYPHGAVVDTAGNVYVTDNGNQTIRKITAAGVVSTLAGSAGIRGSSDGQGDQARFNSPEGVAVDGDGNVYVADTGNYTVRKITRAGVVTTLAGAAGSSSWTDGKGGAARFAGPEGVAVDGAGNVYVTDNINYSVRSITAADTVVADTGNYTIRRITPAGDVSTLAGLARGSTDGVGRTARFDIPCGVAVDATGNIFVSCSSSDSNTIRRGRLAGPPAIATQPQSQTVTAGGSVQFSVTATAVPDPAYQWYFNGSPFSGATASTLSFANARSTDAGDYTVVVSNELGAVTSIKATLTVSSAPVTPLTESSGGGSMDLRFVAALAALLVARAGLSGVPSTRA